MFRVRDKIKIQNKYITEKIVSKVGSKKFLTQSLAPSNEMKKILIIGANGF